MATQILPLEVAVIENKRKNIALSEDFKEASLLTELLLEGKYVELLASDPVVWILGKPSERKLNEKFIQTVLSSVEKCFKSSELTNRTSKEFSLLCVGISCLQLFVQNNWVGPPTASPVESLTTEPNKETETNLKNYSLEELSVDAEPVFKQANHHFYLLLSRAVFLECRKYLENCQSNEWWLLRCVKIQQCLLEERSPTLRDLAMDLIRAVSQKEPLMTDDKFRDAQMQFAIEAGHICHFYYETSFAKEHISRALKLSGLDVELTGAMGKRTKFQTEDKAQLVLRVRRPQPSTEKPCKTGERELPKNVSLEDDTVLNEIKFSGDEGTFVTNVTPVEQSLILALGYEHRNNHESISKIMQEESMAYLTSVLGQPQNWCVTCTSTLLRAHWEKDSIRRAERTLLQLEELVTQFERPSQNAAQRLDLLYSVQLPPQWGIQREQANFLIKIGSHKGALDIFLRLEMWEDVITCYKVLGQTEKAEKAIREQLSLEETPSLWCHLGDVLDDPECYRKAWKISNCRYARAQRSLGFFYLYKAEFEEAVPYFEKSLEINSLQAGVWFSFGCACMGCSKWEKAAKAFRRCLAIDFDNFEAWSNLATAYIKLNQKVKAFNAMQEALKCEYEDWRLWENLLLISTDIGYFSEAIRAFHRLLDLKNKYTDSQVLTVLVRAINENMKDAQDKPAAQLKPKALELFGRITSKVTNEADVWRLYAALITGGTEEPSQSDRERALQFLQKSLRSSTQTVGWEKDVEKCKSVAEESSELAKAYLDVVRKVDNPTQAIQLLSSARLMLKSTLAKIMQKHTDPVSKELQEVLREPCGNLEVQLQKIVDLTEKLKGR